MITKTEARQGQRFNGDNITYEDWKCMALASLKALDDACDCIEDLYFNYAETSRETAVKWAKPYRL